MRCGSSDALRAASTAAIAFATAVSAFAIGVLAQPAHLYVTVDAATATSQQITVTPTGEDAAVVVTPTFFDMDDRGRPRSSDFEAGRSVVPWLSVTPSRFVLTSPHSQAVDLHLEVPSSAAGSYWGAVALEVQPVVRSSVLAVQPRIMIPIVITVRGTERPHVRMDGLLAFVAGPGEIVVQGSVANDGNVLLRGHLVVAIETGDATDPVELASSEDAVLFVLPGNRRQFRIAIQGDFGGVSPLRASIWIPFADAPGSALEAGCEVLPAEPCTSPECRRG